MKTQRFNFNLSAMKNIPNTNLQSRLDNERKIANSLQAALDFQSLIFENSLSGIFVLGIDGSFVQSNKAGASILGFTPEELFGKSALEIFSENTRRKMKSFFMDIIHNKLTIREVELRVMRKGGSAAMIIMNASPIIKENNVIGIVCSAEDITKKRQENISKKVRMETLEMLAKGKELDAILRFIIRSFKNVHPFTECTVFSTMQFSNRLMLNVTTNYSNTFLNLITQTNIFGAGALHGKISERKKRIIKNRIERRNYRAGTEKNIKAPNLKSFMSQLIEDDKGKNIGTFNIYSTNPEILSDIDPKVFEEYCQMISIAMDRKKTENELISRNKSLTTLYSISSVIMEGNPLDTLIEKIFAVIRELKDFHFIPEYKIFLNKNDSLELLYQKNTPDSKDQDTCKIVEKGKCLCGMSFENGEVLVCGDSETDPRHEIIEQKSPSHGHIIIPLIGRDKISGILCLHTVVNNRKIEEADKFFFLSIGRQVGLAIENAMLYSELEKLTMRDPLTGLANRRSLELTIKKLLPLAKRSGQPVSVAFLDIDFFKKYNDTNGHTAGDEVLINIANILAANLRAEDLAVRYGGEEFLLIFANTDINHAQNVLDRIRLDVLDKTNISISAGLAQYDHRVSFEHLLEQADRALYYAKDRGRNQVVLADSETFE